MVLRVQHKFRQRNIEWMASIEMALLGFILLHPEDTFSSSRVYDSMAAWMPELLWGWFLLFVGVGGLVGLVINGSMESVTPWIRVCRAIVGCIVFSMIAVSMLVAWLILGHPPPIGIAMFAPACGFELAAIYYAMKDARIYRNGRQSRSS